LAGDRSHWARLPIFGLGQFQVHLLQAQIALPTLFIGMAWAYLLGQTRTLKNSHIRVGWAFSLPLAVLNGALSSGLAAGDDLASFLGFAVAGGGLFP